MDEDRAFSLYTATDDGDSSWAAPDVKEMHVESDMAAARQHLEDVSVLLNSLSRSRSVEPALETAHLANRPATSTTSAAAADEEVQTYNDQQHPRQYRHRIHTAEPIAGPAQPSIGSPVHSELNALRVEVEELKRQHRRPGADKIETARPSWETSKEEYQQKIAKLEAQEKQHQTHVTTCLTTLHCLVSELRDIYDVQGVTAPNEPVLAESNGSTRSGGVVSQLFGDIQRLFRALAFGVDGTLQDGDTLTAATLLENRDLRASLIGKEHELARRRAKDQEFASVQLLLEEANVTIRRLEATSDDAARRSSTLAEELAVLTLQKGADENATSKVERQRQLYQDRAREWQSFIDKTVVESELTKAHANAVTEMLESSREDVAACKRQLAQKTQESDGLRQTIQSLGADLATMRVDLQTMAYERTLLTSAAVPSALGPDSHLHAVGNASQINYHHSSPRQNNGSDFNDNDGSGSGETAASTTYADTLGARYNVILQDRVGAAVAAHTPTRNSPTPTEESGGKDSWQAAAEILEHDRHLTQQELSQIDREISELQRSLTELSGSTANRVKQGGHPPG